MKGKIRPDVVDKIVDLHVSCGTPMSHCARALMLGGEATGIEWEDSVASQINLVRGLIKRCLLHKLALARELAGIEWVTAGVDSTTSR
jgi:hypothetical protein